MQMQNRVYSFDPVDVKSQKQASTEQWNKLVFLGAKHCPIGWKKSASLNQQKNGHAN